jgi:hypothetical protein
VDVDVGVDGGCVVAVNLDGAQPASHPSEHTGGQYENLQARSRKARFETGQVLRGLFTARECVREPRSVCVCAPVTLGRHSWRIGLASYGSIESKNASFSLGDPPAEPAQGLLKARNPIAMMDESKIVRRCSPAVQGRAEGACRLQNRLWG